MLHVLSSANLRQDMQELITAKSNIDHLLGLTDAQKNKEMER
jgi:hypothetical protein